MTILPGEPFANPTSATVPATGEWRYSFLVTAIT
jgi:hypothetical protein